MASITLENNNCSVTTPVKPGYSLSCENGTSNTKKFTLVIERFTQRDATEWWCQLENTTARSNTFKTMCKLFTGFVINTL